MECQRTRSIPCPSSPQQCDIPLRPIIIPLLNNHLCSLNRAPFQFQLFFVNLLCGVTIRNNVINHQDNNGRTPLHYAAYQGSVRVVKQLCIAHADVNALDRNGTTLCGRSLG
uniref:Uncharacterized protein n=1 Tax=Spongospora subterranea TaxID=70186 RepID=A0A0H5R1I9_9EUKA|eukprot:CRZ07773.1 hypothetical protein [Spongospora subterranea]